MMKKNDISAAILSGGKSRRFGKLKENARFNHRSLLEIAVETAAKISSDIMVITGNGLPELPKKIRIFDDLIPGCGPIGGILTALHNARNPVVAIMPCDMPLLSAEVYKVLSDFADSRHPATAVSGKGLEPMVSILPKSGYPNLLIRILANKFSLRDALSELETRRVLISQFLPDHSEDIFININYQEDLKILKQRFTLKPLGNFE